MNKEDLNNNTYMDFLLILLLVGTTGFSFFYKFDQFVIVLFVLSALMFFVRKRRFDKGLFYVVLFLLVIQIIQGFKFSYWPLKTFTGLHVRIFAAYFTIKAIGDKFIEKYIKFISLFAKLSLIIFVPLALSSGLVNFFISKIAPFFVLSFKYNSDLYSLSPNILIYNLGGFTSYSYPRNSGPFWEPGAFAGFLIIAIVFELIKEKKLFSRNNVINIIALLTTFSTTGYLALFVIILYYFIGKRINILNVVVLIIMAVIMYNMVIRISFLEKKINNSIFLTKNSEYKITRFQSALLDLNDFIKNPFVGTGRNANTRFAGYKYDNIILSHRNNGITNILATYGVFFFILYWVLYNRSFKRLSFFYKNRNYIKHAQFVIVIMFIIGFSEVYFFRPLFYSFLFLNFVYDKNSNSNSDIQPSRVT